MHANDIPEINDLSIPEKILLIEELWDSIAIHESVIPVPESHKIELKNRITKLNSNPGALLTLDELKAKIDARK